MQLKSLYLYPVKSCAPLKVESARVEARGLAHDRRWMVVDHNGVFVTGRQFPKLTLMRALPEEEGTRVTAPGMPSLVLDPPAAPLATVSIWKNDTHAFVGADAGSEWISSYLGIDARFVYMGLGLERHLNPNYAQPGDLVSFADSFPIMLIGDKSLELLNSKLATPVAMERFRPNLVVRTAMPHEEDDWARLSIGGIEFEVAKACTRCNFVNVDPASGARSEVGEPLKTLTQYRRSDIGVTFGRHLIPRGLGEIRLGDEVTVVSTV